jgi:hypothetical protein
MDSCTRFSTLGFFHQSTPPRALIHGLKLFYIWPNIRRKNRQYSNFSGVNDPTETILAGHWPRWNYHFFTKFFLRNYEIVKQFKNFMWNFSGVIDPAEIYKTPLKFQIVVLGAQLFFKLGNARLHFRFQRGHWPRWNDFDDFRSIIAANTKPYAKRL